MSEILQDFSGLKFLTLYAALTLIGLIVLPKRLIDAPIVVEDENAELLRQATAFRRRKPKKVKWCQLLTSIYWWSEIICMSLDTKGLSIWSISWHAQELTFSSLVISGMSLLFIFTHNDRMFFRQYSCSSLVQLLNQPIKCWIS